MLALLVVFVLVGRVNTRLLALVGACLVLINAPIAAFAPSLAVVAVGLIAWIFGSSLLSTPMAALQLEVQRRYGRSLIGGFIACWSLGSFVGAGLGTLAAGIGASPGLQFAFSSAVLAVLLLVCARWLPEETLPERAPGTRRRLLDRFTTSLLLLALLAFLTSFVNGAPDAWSATYTQSLGASAAVAAATYTAMTITSTVGLLASDRLISRFHHTPVMLGSMAVAACGMGLAIGIATPPSSIAGFALLALGMACTGPVVWGQVDRLATQVSAGESASMIEMGYLPGQYISPLLIGVAAYAVGLRAALLIVVAGLAAMVVLQIPIGRRGESR